jgi:Icc-related predicted phosphoesterase
MNSIYAMSDIHGNYDTFISMLKKIKFDNEDTLYINGDAIDRSPDSIKILKYCMGTKNIIFIRIKLNIKTKLFLFFILCVIIYRLQY